MNPESCSIWIYLEAMMNWVFDGQRGSRLRKIQCDSGMRNLVPKVLEISKGNEIKIEDIMDYIDTSRLRTSTLTLSRR